MYTHITRDDSAVISDGLRQGESYATIGGRIGKDKGAVWREVERNKDADGQYRPWSAQRKAKQRRTQSKHGTRLIENNALLEEYLERFLDPLVSPEVAAHEVDIHHQTIYSWIERSRSDLKPKLPYRGKKRRRYGSKREIKQGWTRTVHPIEERILQHENWEGDTVKGATQARLLTHVERESLFTLADILPDGTADSVHAKTVQRSFEGTITYDRGGEFALWKMVEEDTGVTIYFADPHHPWQRGKNENTNGRFRRVFPKKFDFSTITQREVEKVVRTMNHTPRKSLSWRTPCGVYGKCCTSS